MIKQTGLIIESKPKDWVAGVSSPIIWSELNATSDWIKYKPEDEVQFLQWTFDTMSCATFSALNTLETIVNYYIKNDKLTVAQIEYLNKEGYITNGLPNFSDRFTAIMSGTTANGNTSQNVWDSIRKDGVLPEKDLPFDAKTFAEYHDKSKITEAMKAKAKKFLDIFSIMYEFSVVDNSTNDLKCSPLSVAIPKVNPSHAVEFISPTTRFDTYPPFLIPTTNSDINYAIKVKVDVKKAEPKYQYFNTKTDPKIIGVSDDLMILLDAMRSECGFPFRITSGYRTEAYNATLKDSASDSAHTKGLAVDIYCVESAKRMAIIKSAIKHGINRIGVSPTFVHVDISTTLPLNVMWLY